ncbi:MAG: site-2 protease family protein [Candidatus Micrarchaeia archaeon]
MALSIKFKLLGIEIELHWSFLLLILLISLSGGLDAALSALMLFTFVVLHELSHSIIAIRNGVEVRRITLFPIGGMAMIEEISIPPDVELKLAIAGPIFNFIVVAIAFITRLFLTSEPFASILSAVIEINLILGLFNLLPAIPLDGGRVWRSIQEKKVGHLKATEAAVKLSRFVIFILLFTSLVIALLTDVIGFLVWNTIIAMVIYAASEAEFNLAVLKESAKGLYVRDATNFSPLVIEPSLTIQDAFSLMLSLRSPAAVVSDFPVKVLSYRRISQVSKKSWGKVRVGSVAQPCPTCVLDEPILEAWKKMRLTELPLLPVVFKNEVIGTVEEIEVEKLIMLNRLRMVGD